MKEQLTLNTPFIDPRWLNAFKPQRIVKSDNQIIVNEVALKFPDESQIDDGIEVEVFICSGYFCAEPSDDIDARQTAAAIRYANERAIREEELKQIELESVNFNKSLMIPVEWAPGIKDVISGLTEGSNGAGYNARTVIHIQLDAPLLHGRLRRNKGDFLCTTANGSNGKAWSDQKRENRKVTCKSCLALAKKWQSTTSTI